MDISFTEVLVAMVGQTIGILLGLVSIRIVSRRKGR